MARHVIHAHSVKTDNGNPKLPDLDRIEYGEIAINYASGTETISFKNTNNELVLVKTDDYYQKKFDDTNKNIEDNEFVTSAALNNLNERINNIPNEVLIGDVITGTPDIFIDTSETKELEIYTREQIDSIISSLETDIEASTAITQQISEKINSLDSDITSTDGDYVSVQVTQVDGKIDAVSVDDSAVKTKFSTISSSITEIKSDLDAFLSAAEVGDEAIDTLKEIQTYIDADSGATIEMLNKISNAQTSANEANASIAVTNLIIGDGFTSASTVTNQISQINTNIENNELVTASALNDLNTRLNAVPDEVFIGDAMEGTPEIFIDTTENETIEIYTQEQVNDKLSAVTANANLYADSVSNNVLVGTESTSDKGNILVDTSEDANIEVYTKAQVDAIVAALEARIQALEN